MESQKKELFEESWRKGWSAAAVPLGELYDHCGVPAPVIMDMLVRAATCDEPCPEAMLWLATHSPEDEKQIWLGLATQAGHKEALIEAAGLTKVASEM